MGGSRLRHLKHLRHCKGARSKHSERAKMSGGVKEGQGRDSFLLGVAEARRLSHPNRLYGRSTTEGEEEINLMDRDTHGVIYSSDSRGTTMKSAAKKV